MSPERKLTETFPMQNNSNSLNLPDVQSSHDTRNIAITRVGVRDITLPLCIESEQGDQHTVAKISMTVSLPADQKGTHMSRFVALMEEQTSPLNVQRIESLMQEMLKRLDAKDGTIEIRFPFFVKKTAPVSHLQSMMNYEACWIADSKNGQIEVHQEVLTPVTSLCPCSKEISRYGAHNQRSHLTSTLLLSAPMSFEEQISVSENAASCQLWARLKRADEKYVTEYAYEHPKFVEDLLRDMARVLNADSRVLAYRVQAENFESIHNHSAFGWIEHDKRQ